MTNETKKFIKVLLWSFGSAVTAGAIHMVASGDLPEAWLFLAPALNSFLYGVNQWLSSNRPE